MNSDCLVNKIVAKFKRLEEEILQRDPSDRPQSDAVWTKKILTTLCNLGKCLKYEAWAAGTSRNPVPNEYRERGEFLYDVSWRELDSSCRIISFPMVAECEWGPLREIKYDFQKLLLARAKVRVMVYYAKGIQSAICNWNQIYRDRLCELVGAFNGTEGDTYLLIVFLDDRERGEGGFKFKFYQITDQGTGKKPKLEKL